MAVHKTSKDFEEQERTALGTGTTHHVGGRRKRISLSPTTDEADTMLVEDLQDEIKRLKKDNKAAEKAITTANATRGGMAAGQLSSLLNTLSNTVKDGVEQMKEAVSKKRSATVELSSASLTKIAKLHGEAPPQTATKPTRNTTPVDDASSPQRGKQSHDSYVELEKVHAEERRKREELDWVKTQFYHESASQLNVVAQSNILKAVALSSGKGALSIDLSGAYQAPTVRSHVLDPIIDKVEKGMTVAKLLIADEDDRAEFVLALTQYTPRLSLTVRADVKAALRK